MLIHPTPDKLHRLEFSCMDASLSDQMATPDVIELSFEERLGPLFDRKITERESWRLTNISSGWARSPRSMF